MVVHNKEKPLHRAAADGEIVSPSYGFNEGVMNYLEALADLSIFQARWS